MRIIFKGMRLTSNGRYSLESYSYGRHKRFSNWFTKFYISAFLFEHDYTNITGYVNNYIDYPVYIDINDFI